MRQIRLLGTPEISDPDAQVPRFRSQRTAALLGYLAAERRTITRERLAALFWPDEPLQKGKGNLRRELHNLGQVLPGCWEIDRVSVRFAPIEETFVDINELPDLAQAGAWGEAAGLLRGDFLEGITLDDNLEFETWLLGEQERWRQRAERVLTRAVEALEGQGAYRRALRPARKLLHFMPWSEETHRLVMRLLALSGQRSAALKQYEICKRVLLDELGVEPTADTTALYAHIKRSVSFALHNIPAATTPLVGRERELALLDSWLADADVRLVSIVGAGGMGKTRLALAVAQDEAQTWSVAGNEKSQFRDGIYFISMRTSADRDQMATAVASTLHISPHEKAENSVPQQVFDYLKNKQMLLVLDNLEHLLHEADLLVELLEAAPQVQIVATSRARLQLSGEHVLALDGLAYGRDQADAASRLFLQAARRIQPAVTLNQEDVSALARICTLVQGMPLALELAASWSGTLSLAAIASEIKRGIDVLSSDTPALPMRHRSIHALFEASWKRLALDEHLVYARLSVFIGGFTLEAARQVCGAGLHTLRKLVTHSLLQYDPEKDRYQMHELLRQYAAGRLAEDEGSQNEIRLAHLEYFSTLAEQGQKALHGSEQILWLERLDQEHGNLKAAISWGQEHDFLTAASLANELLEYWFTRGRLAEAKKVYQYFLERRNELPDRLQAWLLSAAAQILWVLGKLEEMEQNASEALRIFQVIGETEGIVIAYRQLAWAALYRHSDSSRTRELAEKALPYARHIADSYYTSSILQVLGVGLTTQRQYDEAIPVFQESLRLSRLREDRTTAIYTSYMLAEIAQWRDDRLSAYELFQGVLNEARELADVRVEAYTLTHLGQVAYSLGDLSTAANHLHDAIIIQEDRSLVIELGESLLCLGDVQLAQNEFELALVSQQRAARLALDAGNMHEIINCLEAFVRTNWMSGRQGEQPVRWLAAASAYREQTKMPRLPVKQQQFDATLAELKRCLTSDRFDTLWSDGQEASLEQALNEAMAANLVSVAQLSA